MCREFSSIMSDCISEGNIVLIFKHLTVKSLLRFRSVCKAWKELIDSPSFVQEHLSVQKPRFLVEYEGPTFLVLDPVTLPFVDTLPRPTENQQISALGTLHGVVCLYDLDKNLLLLWNPSIRTFFSLPLPSNYEWDFTWDCCYGFWIDPSTKEFKIVILACDFKEEERVANGILYSSIRRDWRVIPPAELGGTDWVPCQRTPVMIGGVAHWVGRNGSCNDEGHKLVIRSFNFRQESFEFIDMPNLKYHLGLLPVLFHWQGKLSLLYDDGLVLHSHRCDVYLRQEGSWVKMYGFDLFAPIACVFWLLEGREERGRALVEEMQENGRVLATIIDERGERDGGHLVLYDTKTGCIPLKSGLRDCYNVEMACGFVESLLFP